uniref:Uncharacterized protein n=1 Tax=Anopheles merus TaxID=30066 RepID=A0A182VL59_ANOME
MYVIVVVRYITEVVVVVYTSWLDDSVCSATVTVSDTAMSDCWASVATTMPDATSVHSGNDASFSNTSTDCVSYTIEGEMSSIDTSVATCSICTSSCTSSPSTLTNSSLGVSCTIGSSGTTGFIGWQHGLTGPPELYYSRARLAVLVSGIYRLGFGSRDRDAGNIAWLRRVAFCRRHVLRLRESSLTLTTQPGNDFRVRQIVARPAPGGRLDRSDGSGSRGSNHHHTATASHRRPGKFRRHRWCALFLIATLYAPIVRHRTVLNDEEA